MKKHFKATVRNHQTKVGSMGKITSIDLESFIGKEVSVTVVEIVSVKGE